MSILFHVRPVQDVSVVDVSGRITIGEGATTLRNAIRAMAQEGKKSILLNLGDVGYIDSSGLGALVSSFATMTSVGGRLKLCNLNSRIKDLLLITKLLTVFEVFDDEAAALKSFAKTPVEAPVVHG